MVGDKVGLLLVLLWMDDEVDSLVVMLLVVVAMRVVSLCVVVRSWMLSLRNRGANAVQVWHAPCGSRLQSAQCSAASSM